jgi:disulfide bond formation protein DsbB
MTLTRRQTRFLITCVILLIILAFIPQQTVTENEVFLIAFIGFPLGIYLATDPERISHSPEA